MTWSTSDVAVCSSDASAVRWRSSFSNRAFSMAMTAWAAKSVTNSNLVFGERFHLRTQQANDTDRRSVVQ